VSCDFFFLKGGMKLVSFMPNEQSQTTLSGIQTRDYHGTQDQEKNFFKD
jgi:hypothetical protein